MVWSSCQSPHRATLTRRDLIALNRTCLSVSRGAKVNFSRTPGLCGTAESMVDFALQIGIIWNEWNEWTSNFAWHRWPPVKQVQDGPSESQSKPEVSSKISAKCDSRKEVFFQSCLGKAVPLWGIFMNFCYPLPTMAMGSSPKGNSPTNCTWVFNCQVLSPLKSWISEDFGPFHFSDAPGTSYQVIAFNCLRTQHKSAQMQPSCTPQGSTPSAFLHGGFIQGT